MTNKERLQAHVQIVRENERKLREWRELPHTWREQVETRLLNLRIAEEAMREMREAGVVA